MEPYLEAEEPSGAGCIPLHHIKALSEIKLLFVE